MLNINNENQNNNNNILINYNKFIFILKKLFFFIFMFVMLLFTSYQIYFYYKEIILIKNEKFDNIKNDIMHPHSYKYIFNYKRELNNINQTNNLSASDNNNSNIPIKDNKSIAINVNDIEKSIREKFNGDYSFILNLSSNDYIGNWSQLNLPDASFFSEKINEGVAEILFLRTRNINKFIINLSRAKANSFRIDAILREGKYIDRYVKINLTFYINHNNLEKLLKNNSQLILENKNIKIDYSKIQFLRNKKNEKIDKGNVTLILQKEEYSYASSYKKRIMSQFKNINLIITSKELNVTINTEIGNNEGLRQKVRVYSFILSIFGLIEIYHILKLIMKINEHSEIGNKLSILSISTNCYLKVIICIMHFFLSISTTDEDMSYQFGVPTIIYFFGFTGFELKLLFIVFKTRNNRIANQEIYRKRLLCLYLFFYLSLTIMILNIKECLTNYPLIFFVYSFSWFSQILYSILTNTRPPMSRMYIISLSLSRLYLPVYIKGLNGNFYDLKPSYLKVLLLVIVTFIEVVVLLLQKSLGPRTILPKKYRRKGFDYYKDKVNIELHVSKNPNCVICLESLNVEVDENFNTVIKKVKNKNIFDKIMGLCFLDKLNQKIKRWLKNMEGKNVKKKYMITPCDHVFHTVCLEKWMKQKNECPYCKQVIPPID